jgi:hypothetical protein
MKILRKRQSTEVATTCDRVCQLERIRDREFVRSALWGPRV